MKNMIKMLLCFGMVIIFGIFSQMIIGNQGAWITGGVFLFGMGFGWYASKAQDEQNKK